MAGGIQGEVAIGCYNQCELLSLKDTELELESWRREDAAFMPANVEIGNNKSNRNPRAFFSGLQNPKPPSLGPGAYAMSVEKGSEPGSPVCQPLRGQLLAQREYLKSYLQSLLAFCSGGLMDAPYRA